MGFSASLIPMGFVGQHWLLQLGIPAHREARFVGKLVRSSFRLNDMTIIYPYNVRPPNDVCWFRFAPETIVIRCYKYHKP